MASTLLRTSSRQAGAFRRFISAAAAPSGGGVLIVRSPVSLPPLPPSPLRRLLSSFAQGDQPPKSLEEKVDQMQQQIKEFDQQFEQNLTEVLKWHKEKLEAANHGYFERFLIERGIIKGKHGESFFWRCELAALFVLSVVVGYLLSYVKTSKLIQRCRKVFN